MVLSFGALFGAAGDEDAKTKTKKYYYPATVMKWSVTTAGDSKLPWNDNDYADGNSRDGATHGQWYLHLNFPAGTKLISCAMYGVSSVAQLFYLLRHPVASDGNLYILTGNINTVLRVDGIFLEGYSYVLRFNAYDGNTTRMRGAMVEVELP